ncbi:hypothetical protein [Bradyrhizobium betae]|nr:hypothetical protein [Bradyrhizobium betae]MCS3726507.1 hypothetical protein [Bradyrhizobium betae]
MIILGMWLLIDVLFVIAVTPPHKPKRSNKHFSNYFPSSSIDENSHDE